MHSDSALGEVFTALMVWHMACNASEATKSVVVIRFMCEIQRVKCETTGSGWIHDLSTAMCRPLLFVALLGSTLQGWSQGVLINELQPACRGSLTTLDGQHPDWVELIGTGTRTIDLQDHTLSLGNRHHQFTSSLILSPGQHLLLLFDGHPERGPTHIDLKLAREGGTLLLIAPDGSTMIDLYSWPTLPADVSIGRMPDGGRTWSFFPLPSPGAANAMTLPLTRVAGPLQLSVSGDRVSVLRPAKERIRFTTNGSPVNAASPLLTDKLSMTEGRVVRAQRMPVGALPGPETMITLQAGTPELTYISIAADPRVLFNDTTGILGEGTSANFSRSGSAWRVPVLVELAFGDSNAVQPLGLAVAGSGSRSLPKRSFKLFARDRFGSGGAIELPGLGAWDELFLRADASPHAFLRNLFAQEVAVRTGGHLDVQPSVALPLFLNGDYQGLYRAMPPKNGPWIMDQSGEEAIDLVDGPGNHALRGTEGRHAYAIEALGRRAPVDSLAMLIDLQSLLDLASLDLYTGRADHDLNVRCWRPRTPEGRWRWILFDMDLWAPVNENSLERMCTATTMEAPYVPQLLAHPELEPLLIARVEGMLATVLHPAQAAQLLDSLYTTHRIALERDHERWAQAWDRPSPQSTLKALHAHIQGRPGTLITQFAKYTGRSLRTVRFERPDPEQGQLFIEDLPMTRQTVLQDLLTGIPLKVTAVASPEWEFAGWEGLKGSSPVRWMDPAVVRSVRPFFRRAMVRP